MGYQDLLRSDETEVLLENWNSVMTVTVMVVSFYDKMNLYNVLLTCTNISNNWKNISFEYKSIFLEYFCKVSRNYIFLKIHNMLFITLILFFSL